jgi:hypothetical protein
MWLMILIDLANFPKFYQTASAVLLVCLEKPQKLSNLCNLTIADSFYNYFKYGTDITVNIVFQVQVSLRREEESGMTKRTNRAQSEDYECSVIYCKCPLPCV